MRAVALVVLAVAPLLRPRWRWLVGAAAGTALVRDVWPQLGSPSGQRWSAAATAVALSSLAAWTLPRHTAAAAQWAGWRWAALLGAAAGAFACVPETDQFREVAVVVGAGLVAEAWMVAVGRPPLPASVQVAAWGLVAWAALYGASGRGSAVVGALFALVAPVAAGVAARQGGRVAAMVAGVWVVAGVAVARTGGIAEATRPAVVAAVVAGMAAGVATGAVVFSAARWRLARSPRSAG